MKPKTPHRKFALTVHQIRTLANATRAISVDLIQHLIPPPTSRTNGKGIADVLRALKINDSVLLPINRNHARVAAHRVIGSGNYAVRREGEGARVWRIK
jgi:hypothetical protein